MKKSGKLIAFIAVVVITLTVFAGCGKEIINGGGNDDPTISEGVAPVQFFDGIEYDTLPPTRAIGSKIISGISMPQNYETLTNTKLVHGLFEIVITGWVEEKNFEGNEVFESATLWEAYVTKVYFGDKSLENTTIYTSQASTSKVYYKNAPIYAVGNKFLFFYYKADMKYLPFDRTGYYYIPAGPGLDVLENNGEKYILKWECNFEHEYLDSLLIESDYTNQSEIASKLTDKLKLSCNKDRTVYVYPYDEITALFEENWNEKN